MMGGGRMVSGYGILLILTVVPGAQCEDLTGVAVAASCAGILALVIFVGLPILCYMRLRRHSKNRQPKSIPNGNIPHQNGIPHYIKNGLPPPSLRGVQSSYRGVPPAIVVPPPGTWRVPFPGPVGSSGRNYPPPMMMHPYFYGHPYRPVIYIDDYEDERPSSRRSTVRQHRERYHGSFFGAHTSPSKMVIKELDNENDNTENTRAKATTRSRSRSPPPRAQEVPRSPTPEPENEDERIDEMFNFGADPQAGDVMFQPSDPNVRKPSEEEYTYSTVIKPAPTVEQSSGWGAPDEDMRPAPTNQLGMSMSRKIEDIVQEGWGEHLIEMNEMETEEPEPVQMRKSVRRTPTPELDIPTTPRTTYIRPPTPPVDIPKSPTDQRPGTPPHDYKVSKPPPPPVPKKDSVGRLSQSQAQNQTKGLFTNQVLEELRQRQKSVDDSVGEDDDERRAVTFSSQPPGIIPRSEPNSPRQSQTLETSIPPAGIPIPPPPPPLPPLPK